MPTLIETVLQEARDSYPNPQFHDEDVARCFDYFVKNKKCCLELRAVGNKSSQDRHERQTSVGFYNNKDAFMRDCKINNCKRFLYVGMNPRPLTFLTQQLTNRLSGGNGARADEIINREYILIDLDTERAKNTCATDDEIRKAYEVFEAIRLNLIQKGIQPLCGFSGNGFHLIIKTIVYPNDGPTLTAIKLLLRHFNRKYGNRNIRIDTTTCDIGRVVKVYGTASIKGENTQERPWRTARVLELNSGVNHG